MDPLPTTSELAEILKLPEHRRIKWQARGIAFAGLVALVGEWTTVAYCAGFGFFVVLARQELLLWMLVLAVLAFLGCLSSYLICHDIRTLQSESQLALDFMRHAVLLAGRTSMHFVLVAKFAEPHTRELFMRGCGMSGVGCNIHVGCWTDAECGRLWTGFQVLPIAVGSFVLALGVLQVILFWTMWLNPLVNPSRSRPWTAVLNKQNSAIASHSFAAMSLENLDKSSIRRAPSLESESDEELYASTATKPRTIVTLRSHTARAEL